MKEDFIGITITGPKKFRQAVIDKIYEFCDSEDLFMEGEIKNIKGSISVTYSSEPSDGAFI